MPQAYKLLFYLNLYISAFSGSVVPSYFFFFPEVQYPHVEVPGVTESLLVSITRQRTRGGKAQSISRSEAKVVEHCDLTEKLHKISLSKNNL